MTNGQPLVTTGTKKQPDGTWCAWFRIGVQTFALTSVEDKSHALWYKEMLDIAFKNLFKGTQAIPYDCHP